MDKVFEKAKKLELSKEFIDKLHLFQFEENNHYQLLKSETIAEFYSKCSEYAIREHIEHISSDYEEDGYITVLSHGYIKDDEVICELLLKKKE